MDAVARCSELPQATGQDPLAEEEEIDVVGTPNTSTMNNSSPSTGTVIYGPLQLDTGFDRRLGPILFSPEGSVSTYQGGSEIDVGTEQDSEGQRTTVDHDRQHDNPQGSGVGPSLPSSTGNDSITGSGSYNRQKQTGLEIYRGYGDSSHLGGQRYPQQLRDWGYYNTPGMNYWPSPYSRSGSSYNIQQARRATVSSTTSQAQSSQYNQTPSVTIPPPTRSKPSDQIDPKEECLGMEVFDFFNSSIQQLDLLVVKSSLWKTATSCLIPLKELSTNVRKVQQQFNTDLVRNGHIHHSRSYCSRVPPSPPAENSASRHAEARALRNPLILRESKKEKEQRKRRRMDEIMLD